jgi:hypothetical protein
MIAEEVLDRLKRMSNPERLEVIQVASRLIGEDLRSRESGISTTPPDPGESPILRVAGCLSGEAMTADEIEEVLYGREDGRHAL